MNILPKSWQRRWRRALANSLLPLATLHAKIVLRRNAPLRLLIDSSVLGHGVTHETGWISTGPKMWGHIEVPTGYMAQVPVHAPTNEGRVYREVRYLAGIAHLARTGHLKALTSSELSAEQFRQPVGRFRGYGWADYSVFRDVKLESVDGYRLDLVNSKVTQHARIAACADPLFRALLDALGPKMSLDAYHIYTAEKHGLYCFLHIDFPLAEKVRQSSKKEPFSSLRTRILLPSEFASAIRLLPLDSNLLTLADDGSLWASRPDLHMHEQRRQRRRKSASPPGSLD